MESDIFIPQNCCANCNNYFHEEHEGLLYEITIDVSSSTVILEQEELKFEPGHTSKILKISNVLSIIYPQLNYASSLCHLNCDLDGGQEEIKLCSSCCSVIKHLYKFLNQFNEIRSTESYLYKKIENLNSTITQLVKASSQTIDSVSEPIIEHSEPLESNDVTEFVETTTSACLPSDPFQPNSGPWVRLERIKLTNILPPVQSEHEGISEEDELNYSEEEKHFDEDFSPTSLPPSSSASSSSSEDIPIKFERKRKKIPKKFSTKSKKVYKNSLASGEDIKSEEIDLNSTLFSRPKRKRRIRPSTVLPFSSDEEEHSDSFPLSDFEDNSKPSTHKSNRKTKVEGNEESLRGKYNCKICGEKFKGWEKYVKHREIHESTLPFSCTQLNCSRKFGTEPQLNIHIVKCQPVQCPLCRSNFRNESRLETHMKKSHKGTSQEEDTGKGVTCQFLGCGKRFPKRSVLLVHEMAAHTGTRPFKCSHEGCDSSFVTKGHLKRHLTTHDPTKLCLCSECGKSYKSMRDLRIHERLHTMDRPYCCDVCGKSFTHLHVYNNHLLIHKNEKPHLCENCGATFRQRKHLKRHEQIHSGLRPYKCDICGLTFPDNRPLKKHLLTHQQQNETTTKADDNIWQFFPTLPSRPEGLPHQ